MQSVRRLRRWLDKAYPRRRAELARRSGVHNGPFGDKSTGVDIPVSEEDDDPPR